MQYTRPTAIASGLLTLMLAGTALSDEVDVRELTIGDIQEGFDDGRWSAEELTAASLARIEQYEPYYNSFTFMNPDALEQARAIDERRAAGEELGPLAGVPVVVKEAMDFAGLPSTAGWSELSSATGGVDLIPEHHAPVVARLIDAGAIVLGKTNIPAFSSDGTRANSSWDGPTYNAVDRDIAPGASSSGTATAVAGSFAVAGLAEETGGSIQNPASAQSLVSVKPTFGLVPNAGVTPLAGSTRDVVGPHARNVTDAALLLDVLAGYTSEDPKTVAAIGHLPAGGYTSMLDDGALEGARVGLYGPGWRDEPLSEEATELYANAVEELESLNATVIEDPFAGSDFAALAKAEGGYDGRGTESMPYDLELYLQRMGDSAAANSVAELLELVDSDPLAEDGPLGDYNSMPVFAAARQDPTVAPDLSEFAQLRADYLLAFNSVMQDNELDLLVFPQMSQALPEVYGEDAYPATTVSEINISGLPGVTVPAGQFSSGSPFGLIFVGPMWSEAELLGYAYAFEQATHQRIVPELVEEEYPIPDTNSQ